MKTKKESTLAVIFLLLFSSALILSGKIEPANAAGTVYIRADGSVDPPTAPIQQVGDYYTFTGNITSDSDGIIVQRDNMTLDGQGYWLEGSWTGITLSGRGNVTIRNVQLMGFSLGASLDNCQNITLFRNNMTENGSYGVYVSSSSDCTISENRIIGYNEAGLVLGDSHGNTIAWNNVTRVTHGGTHSGIVVGTGSYSNTLTGNTVANNWRGIALSWSTGNTLRGNSITSDAETVNPHGFVVEGQEGNIQHFIHDVDSSNMIQGKPIYFWINQTSMTVPTDASTVILVDCDHITVQNMDLSKSYYGVLLYATTDCLVSNNEIVNNYYGVRLYGSSRNTVTQNEISGNDGYGVDFAATSNDNVISGNSIVWNNYVGIEHYYSSNTIIQNNNVTKTVYAEGTGIVVSWSANVTMAGNTVAQHDKGIVLGSGGNALSGNTITACEEGLRLSSGNTLSTNVLTGNTYSLSLSGGSAASDYVNYVDSSNVINGKPVCYWVDQHDTTVPSNAGYVFLVSCSGIIVENLHLAHEAQGIGLVAVADSVIRHNFLEMNDIGVMVFLSSGNSILGNTIAENLRKGIEMRSSSSNTVSGNNMTGNGHASSSGVNIQLMQSSGNTISGNIMRYSQTAGVYLWTSSGNVVSGNDIRNSYHSGGWKYGTIVIDQSSSSLIVGNEIRNNNVDAISFFDANNNNVTDNNIISNLRSIRFEGSTTGNRIWKNNIIDNDLWLVSNLPNSWDNGYAEGGNHWSPYTDVDVFSGPGQNISGSDGIWDNPVNLTQGGNNVDHYVLVNPTKPIVRDFEPYGLSVEVYSNSSVSEFQFDEMERMISFNVSGQTGTGGFCDVAVPDDLLWGTMSVYKDGALLLEGAGYTKTQNDTHYLFHITYDHSVHTIEIKGTEAIPEYTSIPVLTALMFVTLAAFAAFSKRNLKALLNAQHGLPE